MSRTRASRSITLLALSLLPATLLSGCRTPWVTSSIVNNSGQTLTALEVTYPKAAFGVTRLETGHSYPYRFKPVNDGPLQLQFTDATGRQHSSTGPAVKAKHEMRAVMEITPELKLRWQVEDAR